MNDPGTNPQPSEPTRPPLQLADDSSAGESTAPVDAGASASLGATDPSSGSSGAETTTGGFDTMFGKLVVKRGLVTAEEVETCNALLQQSASDDSPRTLADVLIDNDYMTRRQLNRLRDDFETKKSTQQIPGYRIKGKLGSGAMATVFLARQLSLDRLVAIKVLPKRFSSNSKFIDRFYKEGRAAAQLNHPNIVGAYDVGQAGEHHYFVMEYVDGETVFDRIVRKKRFEEEKAIEIIRQVARALEHAHDRGFIHRDIKPKNIMLSKSSKVKLADLGLARALSDKEAAEAEAGRAYGTPYYISPEQIRGKVDIGPAADIYGLGATFYHMVTGRVPFDGKNPSEVMHKHLKADLEPPDHVNPKLSTYCAEVIEMMMAKKVADRYHTVHDLLEDLDRIADGQPPLFAHQGLGIAAIAHEEVAEHAAAQKQAERATPAASSPMAVTNSPVFWFVAIGWLLTAIALLVTLGILLS